MIVAILLCRWPLHCQRENADGSVATIAFHVHDPSFQVNEFFTDSKVDQSSPK